MPKSYFSSRRISEKFDSREQRESSITQILTALDEPKPIYPPSNFVRGSSLRRESLGNNSSIADKVIGPCAPRSSSPMYAIARVSSGLHKP